MASESSATSYRSAQKEPPKGYGKIAAESVNCSHQQRTVGCWASLRLTWLSEAHYSGWFHPPTRVTALLGATARPCSFHLPSSLYAGFWRRSSDTAIPLQYYLFPSPCRRSMV